AAPWEALAGRALRRRRLAPARARRRPRAGRVGPVLPRCRGGRLARLEGPPALPRHVGPAAAQPSRPLVRSPRSPPDERRARRRAGGARRHRRAVSDTRETGKPRSWRRLALASVTVLVLATFGVTWLAVAAPAPRGRGRAAASGIAPSATRGTPGTHHYLYVFPDQAMWVYGIDHS